MVKTYGPDGKQMVLLGAAETDFHYLGGLVQVYNKTGEDVVLLHADEHGDGVVGLFNDQGMGRELKPGLHAYELRLQQLEQQIHRFLKQ